MKTLPRSNIHPSIDNTKSEPDEFGRTTTEYLYLEYGLTKREYFAAIAMQGILAKGYGEFLDEEIESMGKTAHECTAIDAVRSADALIKELNK